MASGEHRVILTAGGAGATAGNFIGIWAHPRSHIPLLLEVSGGHYSASLELHPLIWEGTAHGRSILPASLFPLSGISLEAPAVATGPTSASPRTLQTLRLLQTSHKPQQGVAVQHACPVSDACCSGGLGRVRAIVPSAPSPSRTESTPSLHSSPLHTRSWERVKGFPKEASLGLGSGPAGPQGCLLRSLS